LKTIMSGIAVGASGELMVGDDTGDDAAVYRLSPEQALVFTVDFITPLVNDSFLFGEIAAANSVSDVYAMGGKPLLALNVCCFPAEGIPREELNQILRGGAAIAAAAGCLIVGGHTVRDPELKYGLAVVGLVHPDKVRRNSTARAGDRLILTKPVGSGVIVSGARGGIASEEALRRACASMIVLNAAGAEVAQEFDASALTDVTGFGLGGHALGMAKGAKVGFRFDARKVPVFPETMDLIREGVRTGVTLSNLETLKPFLKVEGAASSPARGAIDASIEERVMLFCDPQTSGGLLMAVAAERAEAALAALRAKGYAQAEIVGEVYETGGTPEIAIVG
jgi:selenide,water dikinase